MCFTPLASAATAVVECGIAGYIMHKDKRRVLRPLAAFVVLLGAYQLTEFMLCSTAINDWWPRLGFAIFTFLPVVLMHAFFNLSGKHLWKRVYVLPVFFASFAFVQQPVIADVQCNVLNISVNHTILQEHAMIRLLYFLYYGAFPLFGLFCYFQRIAKTKKALHTVAMRALFMIAPLAVLLSEIYFIAVMLHNVDPDDAWLSSSLLVLATVCSLLALAFVSPATTSVLFKRVLGFTIASSIVTVVILYVVFPEFSYNFPSIYCQFALLYGIAAVLLANREYAPKTSVRKHAQ